MTLQYRGDDKQREKRDMAVKNLTKKKKHDITGYLRHQVLQNRKVGCSKGQALSPKKRTLADVDCK